MSKHSLPHRTTVTDTLIIVGYILIRVSNISPSCHAKFVVFYVVSCISVLCTEAISSTECMCRRMEGYLMNKEMDKTRKKELAS